MTPFGVRRRGRALLRRLAVRAESNFSFSFAFASQKQREALQDVYAFCRSVDDIVDERPHTAQGDKEAAEQLEVWRAFIESLDGGVAGRDTPVQRRLRRVTREYDLPTQAMLEIVDGCAMDLEGAHYENFAELEIYAYRVASCVGFLCLPIFGDTSAAAQRFAHNLGLAMQYTNILRDVGEDAAEGRIYIPARVLHSAGLSPDELTSGVYDERFARVGARMSEVARAHYKVAWAALRDSPHPRRLVPAQIMGRTYEKLLDELRAQNWDVFTRQLKIRRRDKLAIAAAAIARAGLSR